MLLLDILSYFFRDFSLILWLIVFCLVVGVRRRVKRLEQAAKQPSSQQVPPIYSNERAPATPAESSVSRSQREMAPTDGYKLAPMPAVEPDIFDQFGAWIKEDWLLKLGALLLLIGFGWLASYAFLNNWIGPVGRITLGIIAGTLLIILGFWRIKKYLQQGSVFMVLGSTVILLTVYAARGIYNFFDPISALGIMFLSTVFISFASVQYKRKPLALASLILAGIAPLLTVSPAPNSIALFSYLLVVTLGSLWIVALTGWRSLTTAGLIMISIYSLPFLTNMRSSPDLPTLLWFAYAFAVAFFITNTIGILKMKYEEIVPDLITAAGNGLFLLAWIVVAVPKEWQSLTMSLWMLIFTFGAFMIYKMTSRREPFHVYAGVGIAMLAAATAAELHGSTLTVAYAIESGIISFISYFLLRDIRTIEKVAWLLIGPVILSLQNIFSGVWRNGPIFNEDFFVLFVLAATFISLGMFFLGVKKDDQKSPLPSALLIAGSVYVFILVWLSAHISPSNYDSATMFSLVFYTLAALSIHFYGKFKGVSVARNYGGIIMGLVVARLLLVDIWGMALTGRIITFFIIGALLLGTAFIGRGNDSKKIS